MDSGFGFPASANRSDCRFRRKAHECLPGCCIIRHRWLRAGQICRTGHGGRHGGAHTRVRRHRRLNGNSARGSGNALGEAGLADGSNGRSANSHQEPATRVGRLERDRARRWSFAERSGSAELHLPAGKILGIRIRGRDHHRLKHTVGVHAGVAASQDLEGQGCQEEYRKNRPVFGHGEPHAPDGHGRDVARVLMDPENPSAVKKLLGEVLTRENFASSPNFGAAQGRAGSKARMLE